MIELLANTVEVSGPSGQNISFSPVAPMLLTALLLFIMMIPIVIVLLFFFYKKKLLNQQIILAIEKGHPIADLLQVPAREDKGWISNFSAGIGLLFIAVAILFLFKIAGVYVTNHAKNFLVVIPIVLIGLAITRLIRSYYQRKLAKEEDKKNISALPGE